MVNDFTNIEKQYMVIENLKMNICNQSTFYLKIEDTFNK